MRGDGVGVGDIGAHEPVKADEPGRDRISVDDGAWGKAWAGELDGHETGGKHWVRGDGVGVGDVGEICGAV